MPAGDFCATSWRVHPTAAIAASKIASTAGGRSTAASGRRSTAGAASRLSAVSADGSAIVAESEPEGEGGSAGKGKEDKRAKSETGGSELVSGDEDVGAPLIAADAARIPGVESTPGIPALAAAGLAAGGEGGGLALGEWGYAVAGRAARAVGGAGRVVAAALPPESAVLLTACVVGLLTGASVSLFNEAVSVIAVHAIRDTVWQGVPPEGGSTWLRSQSVAATWHLHIFVPLAGGVVVGILNTVRSEIKDLPLIRQPPPAVTLGTGNSLGPEGPSVEIGASVGKGAGKVVQGGRERTIALVAAGSAAGISAGFNAAVAGCFFALESVLRSSVSSAPASLTTAMVLLSSVLAAVVSQQILGSDPAVQIPLYEFRSPAELPLYLLLGLCCGGVSIALTRSARLATDAFDRLLLLSPLPPALLPALGGLSVGVISLAYPEVLYWGFQNINDLLGSRPLASAPQVQHLPHITNLLAPLFSFSHPWTFSSSWSPSRCLPWPSAADQACLTASSLPPHCLLTASSLPPHCLLTASSLPPHCLLTASSLPPHCLLTASSLPPHCLLTASSLPPHCLLTASSLLPHCLLTASSLPPHCLLTASSLPPHCLLTASSLPPHCLLTASSLPPHCLLTASALPPHCLVFFTSTLSLPPPQVDFLLQLVALKVLATAICRGSGLVGGFYAPSLFIGAALGQAYGRLASDVLVAVDPEYNLQWIQVAAPQAYAMALGELVTLKRRRGPRRRFSEVAGEAILGEQRRQLGSVVGADSPSPLGLHSAVLRALLDPRLSPACFPVRSSEWLPQVPLVAPGRSASSAPLVAVERPERSLKDFLGALGRDCTAESDPAPHPLPPARPAASVPVAPAASADQIRRRFEDQQRELARRAGRSLSPPEPLRSGATLRSGAEAVAHQERSPRRRSSAARDDKRESRRDDRHDAARSPLSPRSPRRVASRSRSRDRRSYRHRSPPPRSSRQRSPARQTSRRRPPAPRSPPPAKRQRLYSPRRGDRFPGRQRQQGPSRSQSPVRSSASGHARRGRARRGRRGGDCHGGKAGPAPSAMERRLLDRLDNVEKELRRSRAASASPSAPRAAPVVPLSALLPHNPFGSPARSEQPLPAGTGFVGAGGGPPWALFAPPRPLPAPRDLAVSSHRARAYALLPPMKEVPTATLARLWSLAASLRALSGFSRSHLTPCHKDSNVGMAATLAGVCQVPLTSVLLLFELTRDYHDSASLDVRDGVLLEEQVQRDLAVSQAMRPASSPSVAAVPLLLVQPREYSSQGRRDGETGYRAQGRVGGEAENRVRAVGVANPESGQDASGVGEVEYRPSTVGEAVAAMVASRQWCCVVVGDGGRLEGLLTLVDVQQEVERRVAAERRGAGRGGRGGRRGQGGRRLRGEAGGGGRKGAGDESSGERDGSGGEGDTSGTGAADGGIAASVTTANVTVKGAVEGLPVSVLCTPWQQLETISPAASLYEARRRLTARGIRQLPVVLQVARGRGEGRGEGRGGERGQEGNEEGEDGRGVERGGRREGMDEVGRETMRLEDGEGREERGSDLLLVGLLDRDDIARACRAEATKRLLQL
ncbi:unnamed protein product [Closterium sp. NIES-64]|nr:unnamed protein product [Closterium sp. NIES-64]